MQMADVQTTITELSRLRDQLSDQINALGGNVSDSVTTAASHAAAASNQMGFLPLFMIFVMACFVGFYVVWSVTPALHSPLMSVTNAISSVIIVGAMIALGVASGGFISKFAAFIGVVLASVNIFGGFAVTERMLAMFKKKG
ncbi:MAG: proton-translocating transhydrogenase family protein [Alphaproteobacteria bacterium]